MNLNDRIKMATAFKNNFLELEKNLNIGNFALKLAGQIGKDVFFRSLM